MKGKNDMDKIKQIIDEINNSTKKSSNVTRMIYQSFKDCSSRSVLLDDKDIRDINTYIEDFFKDLKNDLKQNIKFCYYNAFSVGSSGIDNLNDNLKTFRLNWFNDIFNLTVATEETADDWMTIKNKLKEVKHETTKKR